MTAPDLTVVVPARDAEETVVAAVRSVLDHADALLEVVVVDDRSTDRTAQAVASIGDSRVRVVAGRGIGPAAARNDGVAVADGSLVGFADADDLWTAGVPDPRRRLLAADAKAVVRGRARVVVGGRQVGEPAVITLMSTVLVPIEVARAHPLDETLLRGEDLEWFLRVADSGVEVLDVDAVVTDYQPGPGGLSAGDPHAGLLAGLSAAVRRRRTEEQR